MSIPDTNSHRSLPWVVIWLAVAILLAGLVVFGVACLRQRATVAWLDSRGGNFESDSWVGWPCRLERHLSKNFTEPTWSKNIPGAYPFVVLWRGYNAPSAADGARLRQLQGMQKLILPHTFDSTSSPTAFFENLGPHRGLAQMAVNDPFYDDACTVHLALYPNLRKLDLPQTSVTGKSFPTLPRLETFCATGSDFTDAGCLRLATCQQLREIDLAGTKVTVEGVRPLLSLPHLEKIRVREWRHQAEVRALLQNMGRKVEVVE